MRSRGRNLLRRGRSQAEPERETDVTTTCLNCGSEIEAAEAVCPDCGARRRSRQGPWMFWGGYWARRISAWIGILLAVVLLAYFGWTIATHGKGERRSNPVPVHSAG